MGLFFIGTCIQEGENPEHNAKEYLLNGNDHKPTTAELFTKLLLLFYSNQAQQGFSNEKSDLQYSHKKIAAIIHVNSV
jgi:hypothetical protein